MWSLYAIGAADDAFLRAQLKDPDERVRVWAIRFLSDFWPLDTVMSDRPRRRYDFSSGAAKADGDKSSTETLLAFSRLAKSDPSAAVRLALATVLQRLPVSERPELARGLVTHAEDAGDHNLPLMIWYGLIPVGDANPEALATLANDCRIPLVLKFIARRLGEDIEKVAAPLNHLLKASASRPEEHQADVVAGLSEALQGWSKAIKPAAWDGFQAKAARAGSRSLRDGVRDLSALFGDGRALDEIRRVALDSKAEMSFRKAALRTLIKNRPPDLRQICEQLLKVSFLNSVAVRGLALFDDPEIGATLAENYQKFHPSERAAVIETLVSRPAFARALLEEMAEGRIPRRDVTAFHARQIRSFNDAASTKRLGAVWGELRDSPADKQQAITLWKTKLTPPELAKADKAQGRQVYENVCGVCHTLYGHGGAVGPDLTGSGRDNLDYLLDNIIDPSAVVNADFRMTVIELKDGRTLNGLLASKTERTMTLQTMTETLTLDRAEIESVRESNLSLMPEGLLDALKETQVRDLIAYLMNRSQVPLAAP